MEDSAIFRPEWLAFEQELGFRPLLHGPTYADIVKQNTEIGMALLAKYKIPSAHPSVKTSEEKTNSGIRLKIYTPADVKPDQPVVVYFHGGGFVLGSVDEDDVIVSRHCNDTGLVFVSVEYRLAPHFPFPAGLDDCVEATKWCIENAESLSNSRSSAILMGGSAGATLALAVALQFVRDHRKGEIQGVVANQPVTAHPDAVPKEFKSEYTSYDEHNQHTINTRAAMKTFLEGLGAAGSNGQMYPILNSHVKDLPCVYLCACGNDTLRDDARILKKLLDRHG